MNKKLKFILTTVWILFSRGYDAYSTFLLTPDLSREANPLVTIGGVSSWSALLFILSILTIYVLYAFYVSEFRPMNLFPKEKNYSFGNFMAYLYLGVNTSWTKVLYQLPKDMHRLNQYMGHLMTRGLVYFGVVSTIMWLLIDHSDFYKSIHSAGLIYSILIGGLVVIYYAWNKRMYKEYLAQE